MSTLRVGVIGDPVAHSISPAMQQAALDALGIDAVYERWHTLLPELQSRVESLRAADVLGANVTVPHKQAVMPFLDEVTALAQRARAVNTIVNQHGRLLGDNTDVYGFQTALRDACPDVTARTAMVLGAGGAARGVLLALESAGPKRIIVHNRNRDRVGELSTALAPLRIGGSPENDIELGRLLQNVGILINTTSLGWNAGEIPIEPTLLDKLPPTALVCDLTYRDTDLLLAARSRGLATMDGLAMLVHQGARALEIWTGRTAPADIMMKAAMAARMPRQ